MENPTLWERFWKFVFKNIIVEIAVAIVAGVIVAVIAKEGIFSQTPTQPTAPTAISDSTTMYDDFNNSKYDGSF